MTPTDLHDFLRTRRSIRRFKPDPVPDAVIERILTTATYAPSAHHRQPWRFAVLTDPSAKQNLASAMEVDFRRDLAGDSLSEEEINLKASRSVDRITGAPVVIVLCADMSDMDVYPDERRNKAEYSMAVQSAANAGMQLLLAAHAEGLGCVWVCSPLFAQTAVQTALDLPNSWEPQAMYFIGHPAGIPEPRQRKLIDEITRIF